MAPATPLHGPLLQCLSCVSSLYASRPRGQQQCSARAPTASYQALTPACLSSSVTGCFTAPHLASVTQ